MEKSHEPSQESLGKRVKKWLANIGTVLGVSGVLGGTCTAGIMMFEKRNRENERLEAIQRRLEPEMDAVRSACRDVLMETPNEDFRPEDCDFLKLSFGGTKRKRSPQN